MVMVRMGAGLAILMRRMREEVRKRVRRVRQKVRRVRQMRKPVPHKKGVASSPQGGEGGEGSGAGAEVVEVLAVRRHGLAK